MIQILSNSQWKGISQLGQITTFKESMHGKISSQGEHSSFRTPGCENWFYSGAEGFEIPQTFIDKTCQCKPEDWHTVALRLPDLCAGNMKNAQIGDLSGFLNSIEASGSI